MTTPHAPNRPTTAAAPPAPSPRIAPHPAEHAGAAENTPARRDEFYGLSRAFYITAAVACVGFLVVMFGTYVVPNTPAVLAGTIIATLAAIAWIILASILIVLMLKDLFRGRGKTAASRPTRPETPEMLS